MVRHVLDAALLADAVLFPSAVEALIDLLRKDDTVRSQALASSMPPQILRDLCYFLPITNPALPRSPGRSVENSILATKRAPLAPLI